MPPTMTIKMQIEDQLGSNPEEGVIRSCAMCESAYDLPPNRLPTVTLIGRPISSSTQCVAVGGLGSDSDADQASDPTPNNTQTILQPHGRSILALQGQVGARNAQ